MGKKEDIDRLREFKKNLSKIVPIQKMIWFGSRVSGKFHRWSDFDLVIVSSKFRNKKFRYRPLGFRKYWNLNYPVDFLCYTPEEYEKLKKEITIVKEAEKNGIEIQ